MEKVRTISELFSFLWRQKLWWMMPVIFLFVVFGLFIVVVGSSPLAPIVYPLF